MRLLVDNNILIQILAPNKTGLTHPETNTVLERVDERAQAFVADAERRNALILIPTPVLSEFLVGLEESKYQEYLDVLNGSACFEVVDFDTAAAIECAQLPNRKELAQISPGQVASKLKYDRQIVSIALAALADEVWSHDDSLCKIASSRGLTVKSLADIEPPAVQSQMFPPDDDS
ncbi:PIN domain-containing protein [Marinobacter subterrani]|uniref:PIN domain-containing protein n=1 Tax=Marinobacter subterrani TaxID=1658765 RepID=UPI00235284A0|nr:PIN domain-containing protein [Marinobacter subterrani]